MKWGQDLLTALWDFVVWEKISNNNCYKPYRLMCVRCYCKQLTGNMSLVITPQGTHTPFHPVADARDLGKEVSLNLFLGAWRMVMSSSKWTEACPKGQGGTVEGGVWVDPSSQHLPQPLPPPPSWHKLPSSPSWTDAVASPWSPCCCPGGHISPLSKPSGTASYSIKSHSGQQGL